MRYVNIARLEKPISVIGLGTATRVFTPETYERVAALLDRFLEVGGNCIDTAHIYGFGNSEKTLGLWFKESGRRREIILITKGCHLAVDPQNLFGKPWEPRLTPEALRADLSESLERLQTDYVDLYLLHRDDEAMHVGPLVEALNQEETRGRGGSWPSPSASSSSRKRSARTRSCTAARRNRRPRWGEGSVRRSMHPIISVVNLYKEFKVFRHHRGALGALRNLVTREYRVVKAVDGVTFTLQPGELVGYLGPNGAGKSTTLKILTGILVPTSGEVRVTGVCRGGSGKRMSRASARSSTSATHCGGTCP